MDYKPEVLKLVLRRENGGCPDITLTSLDHRPFSITGFEATANSITAEFDPSAKATEFVLKPKVDLAKLEQNMRGRISINLTHPECNNIELMYDVLPEYTISVPSIMMFGLKAGQAVAREIWILSNYEDDFEIESVLSQKGIIKLVDKTKVEQSVSAPDRGHAPAARRRDDRRVGHARNQDQGRQDADHSAARVLSGQVSPTCCRREP